MRNYIRLSVISVLIISTVMLIYTSVFHKYAERKRRTDIKNEIGVSLSENSDVRLAAICADALCQSGEYLTKVAVCGVIFRRMEMQGYPDTAAEIIFSDPMLSKSFGSLSACDPSEESYNAAVDAKLGFSPCPYAKGFYEAENCSTEMLKERTIIKLGKFIFF